MKDHVCPDCFAVPGYRFDGFQTYLWCECGFDALLGDGDQRPGPERGALTAGIPDREYLTTICKAIPDREQGDQDGVTGK